MCCCCCCCCVTVVHEVRSPGAVQLRIQHDTPGGNTPAAAEGSASETGGRGFRKRRRRTRCPRSLLHGHACSKKASPHRPGRLSPRLHRGWGTRRGRGRGVGGWTWSWWAGALPAGGHADGLVLHVVKISRRDHHEEPQHLRECTHTHTHERVSTRVGSSNRPLLERMARSLAHHTHTTHTHNTHWPLTARAQRSTGSGDGQRARVRQRRGAEPAARAQQGRGASVLRAEHESAAPLWSARAVPCCTDSPSASVCE